jgi:hypothetical protein
LLHLVDGSYLISATIFGGTDRAVILRVSSQGDFLWGKQYAQFPEDMVSGPSDTMVGGGYLWSISGSNFCEVIRLGSDTAAAASPLFLLPPSSFILSCFPNPFNPTTTITFSLPRAAKVEVNVYDLTARHVQTLADKHFEAGEHSLLFDGSTLPSGIYFARLQSGGFSKTQKMVLLK